jgi:hypothetical protein
VLMSIPSTTTGSSSALDLQGPLPEGEGVSLSGRGAGKDLLRGPRRAGVAILAMALLGVGVLLWSTPRGVGVGYDSMFYLTSADSLRQGHGLSWVAGGGELRPLVHYPPLYPLVLAGLGWAGVDDLRATTWLAGLLFGLNIGLVGAILLRVTHRGWIAIAGAALALASPVFIDVHLEVMSEPLFLVWTLSALACLWSYWREPRLRPLVAAGAATALAYLTRYVGAAAVATGVLAVIVTRQGSFKRKVGHLALYAGLALMPIAGWYLRNLILTGTATNRLLIFHPVTLSTLRAAAATLSTWLLPSTAPLWLKAGILLVAAAGLVSMALWGWWSTYRSAEHRDAGPDPRKDAVRLATILVAFAGVYVLFLLASLTFFDASTRLDNRILSPVFLAVTMASLSLVATLPRVGRVAGLVLVGALAVSYVVRSLPVLEEMRLNGSGFNSREWETSETIAWVRALPADTLLYSNEAFPILYLTGIPAYWVPEAYDSVKGTPRPDFEAQMETMRQRLRQPGSMLVVFLGSHYRVELPPIDELAAGLAQIAETSDGEVYIDPASRAGMGVP